MISLEEHISSAEACGYRVMLNDVKKGQKKSINVVLDSGLLKRADAQRGEISRSSFTQEDLSNILNPVFMVRK